MKKKLIIFTIGMISSTIFLTILLFIANKIYSDIFAYNILLLIIISTILGFGVYLLPLSIGGGGETRTNIKKV